MYPLLSFITWSQRKPVGSDSPVLRQPYVPYAQLRFYLVSLPIRVGDEVTLEGNGRFVTFQLSSPTWNGVLTMGIAAVPTVDV